MSAFDRWFPFLQSHHILRRFILKLYQQKKMKFFKHSRMKKKKETDKKVELEK